MTRSWSGCSPRRSLPRRLLLDDQPRDVHPHRRPVGAGRVPRDGLRRARRLCAYLHAETVPLNLVRAGELVAVGRQGLRVVPMNRPAKGKGFEFMSSVVSSEKPKALDHRRGGRTDAAYEGRREADHRRCWARQWSTPARCPPWRRLVRAGWIDVVFGGNAIAAHDIEAALYGTSLGVSLHEGMPVHGGHEHHLRAINRIRACGGIARAVEARRAHRRPVLRDRARRGAVRARRLYPRRRPAARSHHRRAARRNRRCATTPAAPACA